MKNFTLAQDISVSGSDSSPTIITPNTPLIRLRWGGGTASYVVAKLLDGISDGDEIDIQFYHRQISVIGTQPNQYMGKVSGSSSFAFGPTFNFSSVPGIRYINYRLRWDGGLWYALSGA